MDLAEWWPMINREFEHEVQTSMEEITFIVQNHDDRTSLPGLFCRMIRDIVWLEWCVAPESRLLDLRDFMTVCEIAHGSPIPDQPQPPRPPFSWERPVWEPWALGCNLEAIRRVGRRYGALQDPALIEWMDYLIDMSQGQEYL